jgi:multidrug efflux pump subunit AcrA (membrane-fusion protein)
VQPAAVAQRDGKSVVFVINADKVAQVAVETGAKIGELIEIRSGLKPGDRVVLRPPDKLHDGGRVSLPTK